MEKIYLLSKMFKYVFKFWLKLNSNGSINSVVRISVLHLAKGLVFIKM